MQQVTTSAETPFSHAAERLLERKRIGLESAIEALETVGYRVSTDDDGHFRVAAIASSNAPGKAAVAPSVNTEFLQDYPELLRPSHIAEITGMHASHVRSLCQEGTIPAVRVGSRWLVPKERFIRYIMDD